MPKINFPALKYHLPLILLALAGGLLVYYSAKNAGASITADSAQYIAIARNLKNGLGFISFDNSPLVTWPPFYPIVLALFSLPFRADPLSTALLLNAIIFGLTIYFAGLLLVQFMPSKPIFGLLGAAAILASAPLVYVSLRVWSEPLYILILVGVFICLEWYLSKKDILSLAALALLAGLSAVTRYLGVTLILWGFLVIVLKAVPNRKNEWAKTIFHLGLYSLISAAPIGAWVIHNYLVSGMPLGVRTPSSISILQVCATIFNIVIQWFVPNYALNHWLVWLIFLALIGSLIWLSRNGFAARLKKNFYSQWPAGLYILILAVFLVISTQIESISLNIRMFSPLYVPMIFIITRAVDIFFDPIELRFTRKFACGLFVSAGLLWVVLIFNGPLHSVLSSIGKSGWGYGGEAWRVNETILFVEHNKIGEKCKVYSNAPDILYVVANIQAEKSPSKKTNSRLSGGWPLVQKACLVWLFDATHPDLYTRNELQDFMTVEKTDLLRDGAVYIVSPKN